jgi:hypothetical protein
MADNKNAQHGSGHGQSESHRGEASYSGPTKTQSAGNSSQREGALGTGTHHGAPETPGRQTAPPTPGRQTGLQDPAGHQGGAYSREGQPAKSKH